MAYRVAAFYQFAALPDFRELREPLRALCAELGLKGSVLLAHEGINGTVAGTDEGIAAFVEALQHEKRFGGRLDHLELKYSTADAMPLMTSRGGSSRKARTSIRRCGRGRKAGRRERI